MRLSGSLITLYLLCEVIPIDVVAVGVSPWTLDVYSMTLQDCGFLEEEDGLLDLRWITDNISHYILWSSDFQPGLHGETMEELNCFEKNRN